MLLLLSIFIRNRNAFLVLVVVVALAKLLLSAFAPASFDLSNIITLAASSHAPIGPWVVLYPPLNGASNSAELMNWVLQPPTATASFAFTSLLLRGPILLVDIVIAAGLYYFGRELSSPVEGRLASLIWFLNPYSFIVGELLGVPDVVAILLMLCAYFLLNQKRVLFAGVALALGTAFKLFPVLLLPPVVFWILSKGYPRRSAECIVGLGLLGLAAYLAWAVLPFGLQYVTNYSPVTQPLPFFTGENWIAGSAFWLILFYCILGLFMRKTELLATSIITLLVYFAVSNPPPQYIVWVTPLMALEIALKDRSRIALFVCWIMLAFSQWFVISSAFLTPSGYSLLFIQLRAGALLGYSSVNNLLFGETFLGRVALPLISSGFYAVTLIYALELGRSWFRFKPTKQPAGAK